MGVTPGKKSPKKTSKGKSPAADAEQMEVTLTTPGKKTAHAITEKAVTPQPTTNCSEKKSDSKKKKSLKRKLDDDEYEEKVEEVMSSEAVVSEDDLNASQKESSKKQKKKKHKIDSKEESKPTDSAKKAVLTSGDETEDHEGKAIPSACKLFVSSLGLEGMSKPELKDIFKNHGYNVVLAIKQSKSRHAFVGLSTEEEARKAKEALDKTDCRGFPLSIDSKDVMLSALKLVRPKHAHLINKEGTADCILYVSPTTPEMTRQKLLASFIGVTNVYYRRGGKKTWARLECVNSAVAKQLRKSQQGKVVEGTALKLETAEEFRKRIVEAEVTMVKQLRKEKNQEKILEKKQKQLKKQGKKSKPAPEESSDEKSDQSGSEDEDVVDEDDDVKVVNDDDSDEEEPPPKTKKTKHAEKR